MGAMPVPYHREGALLPFARRGRLPLCLPRLATKPWTKARGLSHQRPTSPIMHLRDATAGTTAPPTRLSSPRRSSSAAEFEASSPRSSLLLRGGLLGPLAWRHARREPTRPPPFCFLFQGWGVVAR